MKRILQVVLGLVVIISGIVLYNLLRDVNWAHSWLKSILVMLPEIGTIIAIIELSHSAEANKLREERNKIAFENNELKKELDAERNKHLAKIAEQVQRPLARADRISEQLKQYCGKKVSVRNYDDTGWGISPEIAEISDGNIVALFLPAQPGSQASATYINCEDLDIFEIQEGDCPVRIKLKKKGELVTLGEIVKWEDRKVASIQQRFERGDVVCNARYTKQGSSEIKDILIYASRDGANWFQLTNSNGEQFIGNNKDVSIRFLVQEVNFLAEGFQRTSFGSGSSKFQLFV